jgi:inward rectifier potassium channel
VARKTEPFFDSRGRYLVERRGLPRERGSNIINDTYHFLRGEPWYSVVGGFVGVYLAINLVFAAVLTALHADVKTASGFLDYFWFMTENSATVGYGPYIPQDTISHIAATIASLVGIGFVAVATGVVFARFSTSTAKVLFSKTALITNYHDERLLMFRMANARPNAVIEAKMRAYMTCDEIEPDGERVRRIFDLELKRSVQPIFGLSWTAYHVIDEDSPLHDVTPERLEKHTTSIVITFVGIDDLLLDQVYARHAYQPDDIEFDRHFVDILKDDPKSGMRYLDLGQFHATEPPT